MPDSFNCSMSGECISPSAADRPAAPAPTITASYISSTCFGLISKIVAQGLTFAAHVTGARRIIPFMEEISDSTTTPGQHGDARQCGNIQRHSVIRQHSVVQQCDIVQQCGV